MGLALTDYQRSQIDAFITQTFPELRLKEDEKEELSRLISDAWEHFSAAQQIIDDEIVMNYGNAHKHRENLIAIGFKVLTYSGNNRELERIAAEKEKSIRRTKILCQAENLLLPGLTTVMSAAPLITGFALAYTPLALLGLAMVASTLIVFPVALVGMVLAHHIFSLFVEKHLEEIDQQAKYETKSVVENKFVNLHYQRLNSFFTTKRVEEPAAAQEPSETKEMVYQ